MSEKTDRKTPQPRREFLKYTGLGLLGSVLLVNQKLFAQGAAAGGAKPEALKDNDPQATALGFNSNATKVDVKKWPKRAGADGAKQFCYTCQFYQAQGDAKTSKTAPCQIFAGKLVPSKGWCNTWTQNPKVTV
jgi:hypothetical protein